MDNSTFTVNGSLHYCPTGDELINGSAGGNSSDRLALQSLLPLCGLFPALLLLSRCVSFNASYFMLLMCFSSVFCLCLCLVPPTVMVS